MVRIFLINIFILSHSAYIRHFPKSKSLEILILCLLLFLLPGVSLNVYERRTISGFASSPAYAQAILKRWKHETKRQIYPFYVWTVRS